MEGDFSYCAMCYVSTYFNPLPPHGGRLLPAPDSYPPVPISIHSLRMEGDIVGKSRIVVIARFQSTPSAWRETDTDKPRVNLRYDISIHSLRMEGDSLRMTLILTHISFQSTPSAWRETVDKWCLKNASIISIHSLRMEGDSKTAQESVFHFAYPCTILQKRMQKTTFCTRKNGFFRKKGEKFGAKPSASFCAPMIRTDTFPLNFSHRISGSSMSMVSFAPICSTFD